MKTYIDYCPSAPVSINAELITVPSGPPYVVETEHNWIVNDSSIEIWENNDKSGTHLVEEAYDGSVSGSGKFQVDYLGASEGDAKYCNKIFFHADQGGLSFYVWYKTEGDVFGADDANSKALKDPDAVAGNLAEFDANGNPVDSGIDPDTKADKDPDAVAGNLAKFDSSGNPVDSGLSTPNVSDAVSKKHTQNTDTGTTSTTFQLNSGSSGAKIKDNSGVLEARNSVDSAYAIIRSADPSGDDDVVTKGYADTYYGGGGGGLSLIQNGSFEIVDSSTVPWCWEKVGSATLAQDTGERDGYGGSLSLKVTSGGTNNEGAKYTFRHLKASTTYSVYVWMKATSGNTAKVWTTGGSSNLSITSTNTGGEYKSGSFITDSTPTNVVLYVGSETNGDIVWFDALTVIEGSTAPDKYLPSPQPTIFEFQDFYPVASNFPGLETLVGTYILKKYVYALDDTTEEPLGFNFSIPPNFDPSGFIMLECIGWAKTAAASKNIEYTYYYSPKKYGEDWDTAYSSLVSGDLALYSTQDYRDNLRFQLSINTAGLEAYDVVESKIARTAPSANNLSGDYYFEKLRIWIPRV